MTASLRHGPAPSRPRATRWLAAIGLFGLGVVVGIGLLMLVGWFVLLDAQPAVAPQARNITPAAVDEAVQGLRALDPRRRGTTAGVPALVPAAAAGSDAAAAATESARFSATTVDLLMHDLARRLVPGAAAQVDVLAHAAQLRLSLPLSATSLGLPLRASRWANLRLDLQARPQGLPRLRSVALGGVQLPVPAALPAWLVATWAGERRLQQLRLAASLVDRVGLTADGVDVRLAPASTMAQLWRSRLLPGIDLERLRAHHASLMRRAAAPAWAGAAAVPLTSVMAAQLALAAQRAAPADAAAAGQPAERELVLETRHALMAMALWALGVDPGGLLPDVPWAAVPQPRPAVTLRGRPDHALHFLLSAVLAMGAHPAVADVLGLYKELSDLASREGSGFSVDDLVADRAGTAFGEWVQRHPRELARWLPRLQDDAAVMPSVEGLPSGLGAAAFRQRFGRVDSPAYRQTLAEVERRVALLPLYRQGGAD